jgi:transposase InsO family protein
MRQVKSEGNMICDLFSRWGNPEAHSTPGPEPWFEEVNSDAVHVGQGPEVDMIHEDSSDELIPSVEDVVLGRTTTHTKERVIHTDLRQDSLERDCFPSQECLEKDGATRDEKGRWIVNSNNMRVRVMTCAHGGLEGHPGSKATANIIRLYFNWKGLDRDVETFVKACVICQAAHPSALVPRALGEMPKARGPRDILVMDFLKMDPSRGGLRWILVIMDAFSQFTKLRAYKSTMSMDVMIALREWIAEHGNPRIIISDGGSHFANQLVETGTKAQGIQQHISLAYNPWSHGSVERMNRSIIATFRKMIPDMQKNVFEWPDLLLQVQSALNNTPRENLGNHCPFTVFTGRQVNRGLDYLMDHCGDVYLPPEGWEEYMKDIASSQQRLYDQVRKARQLKRDSNVNAHITKAYKVEFKVGDYVMISKGPLHGTSKLRPKWQGPMRVLSFINDQVCLVKSLLEPFTEEQVHICRMRFYADNALELDTNLIERIRLNSGEYNVREIKAMMKQGKKIKMTVSWLGFDEVHDTQEDLTDLYAWVPHLVTIFLDKNVHPLTKEARRVIGEIRTEA